MARFERIVRPFETRDVTPPKRLPTASQKVQEPTLLEFGKEADPKFFNTSLDYTLHKYMDQKTKEEKQF